MENKEMEKPIKDYEGEYNVTSYGRIHSLKSNKYLKLKYQTKPEPGMYIALYKYINGIHTSKSHNVAELVAYAFKPEYDGSTLIYNDENPRNPNLNNLKWIRKFNKHTQFIYYQTIDDEYKGILSNDPNKIITLHTLPTETCNFFISKQYRDQETKIIRDEDIKRYYKDFMDSCAELMSDKNDILKIYYKLYTSHFKAITCTFLRLCHGKHEDHDNIDMIERSWIEKCCKCGQLYIKSGRYKCHGYDYKFNYPTCMQETDFIIPKKQGKEKILNKLPNKRNDIKVGYYHVKITSNHPNINKVFMFSKYDVYTSLSLKYAMKFKKRFNIKIELIHDDKPNAYIYNDNDLVSGHYIFSNWFNIISRLRSKFPNNILIKNLGTMCWGTITQANTTYTTEEHLNDPIYKNYDIYEEHLYKNGSSYTTKYELINTSQPYRFNIRLKGFLPAYCRRKINLKAIESNDIDNIVRIHTDNLTFKDNRHDELISDDFKTEDKTTGDLEWTVINASPIRHDKN
jgi:hypothetical protein